MSSGYLLDTNVVSATAPDRPQLPQSLADLLVSHSDRIFIPSLVIQELRKGIAKLDRSGGHRRAERLLAWLNGLTDAYSEAIISLDAEIALLAGRMEDAAIAAGRHPGLADILIAATAKARSLVLLTANARHFEPLDVECRNPFDVPESL